VDEPTGRGREDGAEWDRPHLLIVVRSPALEFQDVKTGIPAGQAQEDGRAAAALGGEPCWSTSEEQQPCGISVWVVLGELRGAPGMASALCCRG